MRFLRRFKAERGAELIELAVTLPILMALAAGIVDFGILFQRYEVVTNAAREGARVGILPGYGAADVQARVTNYLNAAGLAGAPAASVTYGTEAIGAGGLNVSTITVLVSYPHNFILFGPIAPLLGGSPTANVTLRSASTMRVEAPAAP